MITTHTLGCAVAALCLFVPPAPAQATDAEISALLDRALAPELRSLTSEAQPWMRVVMRAFHRHPLVQQILLSATRPDPGSPDGATASETMRRFLELEEGWLGRVDALTHEDLAALVRGYRVLASFEPLLQVVRVTGDWLPVIRKPILERYRVTGEQVGQLWDYVAKAPARARDLERRALAVALRRELAPASRAWMLRELAESLEESFGFGLASRVFDRAQRGVETPTEHQLKDQARLHILAGDLARARAELAQIRRMVAKREQIEHQRLQFERWIRRVEHLAATRAQLDGLDPADRSPETALQRIDLLRRLGDYPAAQERAEALAAAGVQDARLTANLGLLRMLGGEPAADSFATASRQPNRRGSYHELGCWLALARFLEVAIELGMADAAATADATEAAALRERIQEATDALTEALRALGTVPGYESFGALDALLAVVHAALRQGTGIGAILAAVRANAAGLLRLRGAPHRLQALHHVPLIALELTGDADQLRAALAAPTGDELIDPASTSLRCHLALALRARTPGAASERLFEQVMDSARVNGAQRHGWRGTALAIEAGREESTDKWRAAAREFEAGIAAFARQYGEVTKAHLRAWLLNGLGICQLTLREPGAQATLQDAVRASPAIGAPHLNLTVCAPEPDPRALARLADVSQLRCRVERWRAHLAQAAGDTDAARRSARAWSDERLEIPGHYPDTIYTERSLTWGVGISAAFGLDVKLQLLVTPWLTPAPPLSAARLEELAK